jgi:hypothetical protein
VVVIGVVWYEPIMFYLLREAGVAATSYLQARLVSLEIAALVALIGAAFAGATTRNGLKQGLCVGLAASAIVLGLKISNPNFGFEDAIYTLSGIVGVCLVGGWFGGQLFPPVAARRRRRGSPYF